MSRRYIETIDSPADLRKLSIDELGECCSQLRDYIVEVSSKNPGHLGSSLGAVELAVALHYVFDTPKDKLVWDVGHQAYAHKILTGRREQFLNNRSREGLSGFPSMEESEYDSFGAGHASVSISAALGMAEGARLLGEERSVVAVIGDGSMTGGLAFEGMNNAGISGCNLLVVLNDNNMAIAPNTGALRRYLLGITTSRRYNALKMRLWNLFECMPRVRRMFQRLSHLIKVSLFQQSNLFEGFNFRYFGPIDGHDIKTLVKVFRDLKHISGPKLLHIVTKKGKGYAPAEADPALWHAPGHFDVATGEILDKENRDCPPRYQEVFGETILEMAEENERIIGVTAAMPTGCSLDIMAAKYPHRVFDVGIAEAHAVTFAAGAATAGLLPFVAIYSTFIQRAYDNIIHDVALQRLNVVFCLDRAGLVGEDGATHQGAFDIASLRTIPNMIIAAPMNECELRKMLFTASSGVGPIAIRYPRGRGVMTDWRCELESIEIGRSRRLTEGEHIALLSFGHIGNNAKEAVERVAREGISVEHIDMRFAKPLDEAVLHDVASRFRRIVTVEDGSLAGGFGSAVAEFLEQYNYNADLQMLGIPDKFIGHGTIAEQQRECGYDVAGIEAALRSGAVVEEKK